MASPPPISTPNVNQNTRIGPKIAIFALLLIPLSLIGFLPAAQAQTVTATITGDPFTIGEGNSTLSVYGAASNIVDTDNSIINRLVFSNEFFGHTNHNVDSSERLIINYATSSLAIQYWLIPLDTTLGELQQTINPVKNTGVFHFNHNVTSLTIQNGTTNIYLAIFDDDVITNTRVGAGTAVPLVENGNATGSLRFLEAERQLLFNTTLSNKNIGYIIEFNNPVSVTSGRYPISAEFNSYGFINRVFISNEITRTHDYTTPESIPEPQGLTPAQETTRQNLVNAIAARNLAIIQQNVIVDYWTNSNNPFADDRTLAQARIDYANSHITQSTIQLNSYQAQLDQILNP